MKKQVTFFIVSFLPFLLCAQTTIPGGNVNGTWAYSGSPYEVLGDITIPNGDTLLIEAGVEVVFQDEYTFLIEGSLQAIGTAADSISFTVADTTGYTLGTYTGWYGLRFYYTVDSSKLDYCIVEYSKVYGVFEEESDLEIENSTIKYNSTGVYLAAGSGLEINNLIIGKNRADGIYINYYSTLNATNVTCHENSGNGTTVAGDCSATLNNFNSTNNGGTGIVVNLSSLFFTGGSVSDNLDGGFLIDNSSTNVVLQNLTIDGNNKSGNGGGILCDYGSTIIGDNLTIQYNNATEGGGIYATNQSNIVLDSSTIYYNFADIYSGLGGGVYIERSTVTMSNSSITMNMAFEGGGIYIWGIEYEPSYFTGSNLNISNNTTNSSGAGIYCLNNSHIDLDSTTIYSNHADLVSGNGGGLYMKAGHLTLSNSSVTSGRANNGAGIYVDSVDYHITGGIFSGNMADNYGGGIYQRKGIAAISDVQFNSNSGNDLYSGSTGGAMYCVEADLTLSNSGFTSNHASGMAGGIFSSGSILDIDSVDFSGCYVSNQGSGGGIVINSSPDCNLTDVDFLNCSCDYNGGGLLSYGSVLSLSNVKFEGNDCSNGLGHGGGMYCSSSTITGTNVEFTVNYGGGIYCSSSDFSLLKSEITQNNGGGIYTESTNLVLEKTLIDNNYINNPALQVAQNSQSDIINCTFVNNEQASIVIDATSTVDVLNSIIWNNASPAISGSGVFTATYSDIQDSIYPGTGNIFLDPLFSDPINGGYSLTWASYPDTWGIRSPCIDAGDPSSTKDPDSTWSDMGAYYFHQDHTLLSGGNISDTLFCSESPYFIIGDLTIPTGEELFIEPCVRVIFQGDYWLRPEGKLLALGNETDSIYFYPSDTTNGWQGIRYYDQNTNGQDSSKMEYCKIMYGNANGLSENAKGGGIYCNNSSELLIQNSELSHNHADIGGAIYCDAFSHPVITASIFEYNQANSGGGIYCDNSNTQLNSCLVKFNQATFNGGGIYCNGSSHPLITETIIEYNQAISGGGIYCNYSNLQLNSSYVRFNQATDDGGGIYSNAFSNPQFTNNDISHNQASSGGGIYLYLNLYTIIDNCQIYENIGTGIVSNDSQPSIINSDIYANSTTGQVGGGIYCIFSESSIINSNIYNNSSNSHGSGVFCYGGSNILNNCKIFNNDQGGIYSYQGELHINNGHIFGHEGQTNQGGAGILISEGYGYIETTIIENNNSGSFNGGGLYLDSGNLYMDSVIIRDNTAPNGAGVMVDGNLTISNSQIVSNVASGDGGGIYAPGNDQLLLDNVSIESNEANNGGGVYIAGNSYGEISNSEISLNNSAYGGGIYTTASTIEMNGNNITWNTANYGGGLYLDNITNYDFTKLLIADNLANVNGGGIYSSNSDFEFNRTTLSRNIAPNGSAIFIANNTLQVTNSIVWDHLSPIIGGSGTFSATFSDIQGGLYGIGNIDTDPMFVNPLDRNYTLSWENFPLNDTTKSPCIDFGNPDSPLDPDSTRADMGAFYFHFDDSEFKPVIFSINDVPDDQGHQVVINWYKSGLESTVIEKYTIWRLQNWAKTPWEYIGETPAHFWDEYSFIAPTISDSTAAGVPYYTYLVSAETADPYVFYNSLADSGYSVDNLAPEPPKGLYGYQEESLIKLFWDQAGEDDFDYFALYKSSDPNNFSSEPLVRLSETLFFDTDVCFDTIYYRLTAVDFNGNESESSDTLEIITGKNLNLKVFLEGPFFVSQMIPYLNMGGFIPLSQPYNGPPWNYSGTEQVNQIPNSDIVDWVLLEFRDAANPSSAAGSTAICRTAAFLKGDGTIVGLDGMNPPKINVNYNQNLYLVVWHRNHIGILGALPVEETEGSLAYDFTDSADKVWGGNKASKFLYNGIWGMMAADGNADGNIDNKDKNDVWFLQQSLSGYQQGDFDMNSQVGSDDKSLWEENAGKSGFVPE